MYAKCPLNAIKLYRRNWILKRNVLNYEILFRKHN